MIRAFVGIGIPAPLAAMLSAGQAGLEAGHPVPPENFHLTLAFLGEHQEPVIGELADALSLIGADAFEIAVTGLGTFGAQPRLLFAEVAPTPALSALRKRVRRAARDSGIELPHERYHPHVTLARFGRGLTGDDAGRLTTHIARRTGIVRGSFQARDFTLYESVLLRSGPAYSALASYPLRLA